MNVANRMPEASVKIKIGGRAASPVSLQHQTTLCLPGLASPKPCSPLGAIPTLLAIWQYIHQCFGKCLHSTHTRPEAACPFLRCLVSSCWKGSLNSCGISWYPCLSRLAGSCSWLYVGEHGNRSCLETCIMKTDLEGNSSRLNRRYVRFFISYLIL